MACAPEASLEAAQAALQQGDYPNAIAHLEALCQFESNASAQVKVTRLLADNDTSEISQASAQLNEVIALCQILSHSSNPQIKELSLIHISEPRD